MDFLPENLNEYVNRHTRPAGALLDEIERETYLKVLMPRMVSGHVQGQVLRTFSLMLRPGRILEIGTFTGYSALCLADGLTEDGKLITIDINKELEDMVRQNISKSKSAHKIEYRLGNAMDIIPTLKEEFDLVFIDADKTNYGKYYDLVWSQLRPGGFILADNVLWSGKVVEPKPDTDTKAIMEFNDKIQNDARAENVLFPVRDGIMVIRKIA